MIIFNLDSVHAIESLMQKPDARRKNLLRKGSFLLALFLFQTFLSIFPVGARAVLRPGACVRGCVS